MNSKRPPKLTRDRLIGELHKLSYATLSMVEARALTLYLKSVIVTLKSLKNRTGRKKLKEKWQEKL